MRAGPVLLLAVLLAPPAAPQDSPPLLTMQDEGDVFRFRPTRVEAGGGMVVGVRNAGETPHTLTASDGSFDTGRVEPGATGRFQAPSEPGEYRFYCRYHAAPGSDPAEAMAGVLVVERTARDPVPGAPLAALLLAMGLVALALRRRP